ncbi:MAG: iron-containing alcohol dehydrogenase, partial [Variovorax sp.]|nr:iron-containing alcohol dehydrogenase [Variovorax sp.]
MTTSPATASVGAPRLRVFGAPLRYIQGPGALDSVGAQAALTGRVALLVADRVVLQLVEDKVRASCEAAGVRLEVALFSGEVTPPEIDRLCAQVRALAPTAVIAAGGGKGIDIGKAVAHALGAEVVSVPTVASNDAPTSKIYVVYDDSHRLLAVE